MGNKTLYVRDSDEKIWQRAEELAKEAGIESLSKLVTDALGKEVERLEAMEKIKEDGFRKIVIEVETDKGTRKIAFNGQWLVKDYEHWAGKEYLISVALTQKESYLVCWDSQGECIDDYKVFDYFSDFTDSEEVPEELKSMVASEIGEDYVEFIDI